jgi:hypothetical protein
MALAPVVSTQLWRTWMMAVTISSFLAIPPPFGAKTYPPESTLEPMHPATCWLTHVYGQSRLSREAQKICGSIERGRDSLNHWRALNLFGHQ